VGEVPNQCKAYSAHAIGEFNQPIQVAIDLFVGCIIRADFSRRHHQKQLSSNQEKPITESSDNAGFENELPRADK
jgi:hypothetical protein